MEALTGSDLNAPGQKQNGEIFLKRNANLKIEGKSSLRYIYILSLEYLRNLLEFSSLS